jgi:mono/diheme cytochrome c family protein
MRLAVAFVAGACLLVLAGCGFEGTVAPTANGVSGTLPKQTTTVSLAKGNPAAGKRLFAANGCSGCHTYKPAGSNGHVGPDLDKLPEYAKKANQGSLAQFVETSITNPSAYIEKGYQDVMPKSYGNLPPKQLADLVAFLTQKQ